MEERDVASGRLRPDWWKARRFAHHEEALEWLESEHPELWWADRFADDLSQTFRFFRLLGEMSNVRIAEGVGFEAFLGFVDSHSPLRVVIEPERTPNRISVEKGVEQLAVVSDGGFVFWSEAKLDREILANIRFQKASYTAIVPVRYRDWRKPVEDQAGEADIEIASSLARTQLISVLKNFRGIGLCGVYWSRSMDNKNYWHLPNP